MKNKLLSLVLLPFMLLASSCSNETSVISEAQRIANYTATVGGLCLKQYGRSGREPLLTDRTNIIYKPSSFNEREYPRRAYIYSTIIVLSYWFEYDSETYPTLSWEFSDSSYFIIEETDTTEDPHVIVRITTYPETSKEEDRINVTLTGTVTYEDATALMVYQIQLRYSEEQEQYDLEDSLVE